VGPQHFPPDAAQNGKENKTRPSAKETN